MMQVKSNQCTDALDSNARVEINDLCLRLNREFVL